MQHYSDSNAQGQKFTSILNNSNFRFSQGFFATIRRPFLTTIVWDTQQRSITKLWVMPSIMMSKPFITFYSHWLTYHHCVNISGNAAFEFECAIRFINHNDNVYCRATLVKRLMLALKLISWISYRKATPFQQRCELPLSEYRESLGSRYRLLYRLLFCSAPNENTSKKVTGALDMNVYKIIIIIYRL